MAKSPEVKLAVFGRAGVGKSALVVRFLTKRFIWEYDPTLGETHTHTHIYRHSLTNTHTHTYRLI
uniref:small monomeric GTPase n=1 Tax=Sinocyclocheilus rhinocerous TaxID=307959 RepID=A0A673FQQ1_9TELE